MKLLILGAGMMGKGVAFDFAKQEDVSSIILADLDIKRAECIREEIGSEKITPVEFNANDKESVRRIMQGCSVAVGATSYDHNILYSNVAIESGCHFIDLGGNHDVVDEQFTFSDRAKAAGVTLIPDCGLAPGLVNILAGRAMKMFDEVDSIKIRVGGIPVNPQPPLNYFLVFSARGLINEYIEKARIIENGKIKEVESLDGLEELHFQDPFCKMEAFYTSGGISTMTKTLAGKLKNLDYKTIRYPNHQHYIKFLVDLGLTASEKIKVDDCEVAPRRVLENLLETYLKADDHDAILLRVTADGSSKGSRVIFTQETIDFFDKENNLTAMMRMTAFPAAILALMLARGVIKERGVLYQELSTPFEEFFKELERRNINITVRKQQV